MLATTTLWLLLDTWKPAAEAVLRSTSKSQLALLATALLLLCAGQVLYIRHLRSLLRTPFPYRFGFDDAAGFPCDTQGRWLCPACLSEERVVRMAKVTPVRGWCAACGKTHYGQTED